MNALIFATEREAAPLIKLLSAKRISSDGDVAVFRPRSGAEHTVILISGMGRESARKAALHALDVLDSDLVINAGVSGALAAECAPQSVYAVKSAGLEGALQDRFEVEGPSWKHIEKRSLVTVDEPVFGGTRRGELEKAFDLVDMEGHAIAAACREKGVPCVLVKGVTDTASDSGRHDLASNIDFVSGEVAAAVAQGLNLKPGIGALARLSNFIRVEHTVFCLPLLFTGAWLGAERSLPAWRVVGFVFLAGLGARTLGMALNRIFDRDIDAKNVRTAGRELPSGKMSLLHAYSVAAAGLLAYLLACAGLGRVCLYLAPVPLIPLGLYSLLKRFTSLCHFGIGICLGMAPLGAYVASSGDIDFSREVLLLALYAFCWISGFDIIYALQDVEFDRKIGLKSLPAALGVRGSEAVAACVHAVGMIAAFGIWVGAGCGVLAGLVLAVAAGATLVGHLRSVPLAARFFPCSAVAGVAGALIPLIGGM